MEQSELEKVRPTEATLEIGGRERKIKFGFSAWAKLEDEYGSLQNFGKIEEDIREKPFHVVPHLIWLGLSDREGVTEETVLDDYGMGDMDMIVEVLNRALYGSLPAPEKKKAVRKAGK